MQYKDTDFFKRSEKYPELIETLLFSIDIGDTCGYLSRDYKSTKEVLNNKNRHKLLNNPITKKVAELGVDNRVISLFTSTVKDTFDDIRKNLLSSLQNRGVIQQHRKVLVRIENKRPIVLLDIEEAQYNVILQRYCKEFYPHRKISTFGFSKTDWTELNKRLKSGLGYSEIYTGYYVAFTEKTVATELNEIEEYELQAKNTAILIMKKTLL